MKTKTLKNVLVLFCIGTILFSGCQKEEPVEPSISNQQSSSNITINPNIVNYLLNSGIKGTINNYGSSSPIFVGFTPSFGSQLLPGSIVVYKSWDNKYAKIKILEYSSDRGLKIQWVSYNADGTVRSQSAYFFPGTLYGAHISHADMYELFWQGNTGYFGADYGGLLAIYKGPYSFENLKL